MTILNIEVLKIQTEVEELNKKIKEFEEKFSEIENENKSRVKEAEEAQLKATQLQETIERLTSDISHSISLPP